MFIKYIGHAINCAKHILYIIPFNFNNYLKMREMNFSLRCRLKNCNIFPEEFHVLITK